MQISCLVNDPRVIESAKVEGVTRSQTAMTLLGNELNNAIVLIGNAPTALFEVLRLYRQESVRPAFIVGAPVGFVNALESKAALMETNLDYITVEGRKGGSTVAVAIFNALLRLAGEA
jgi:precorrin-8X/cobalt-precorrin-8 methylmutase